MRRQAAFTLSITVIVLVNSAALAESGADEIWPMPIWGRSRPGETSCLPTKWMSKDSRTCYLLFSGEDCFSVRKVSLTVSDD